MRLEDEISLNNFFLSLKFKVKRIEGGLNISDVTPLDPYRSDGGAPPLVLPSKGGEGDK